MQILKICRKLTYSGNYQKPWSSFFSPAFFSQKQKWPLTPFLILIHPFIERGGPL